MPSSSYSAVPVFSSAVVDHKSQNGPYKIEFDQSNRRLSPRTLLELRRSRRRPSLSLSLTDFSISDQAQSARFRMFSYRGPPSLVCLCVNAISDELIRGDELLPIMKNLPRNLIDDLALRLPPLPLQKLQNAITFDDRDHHEFDNEGLRNGRKRGRSWPFNTAWKILFKLRWPQFGNPNEPHDWQQMYWEAHLQNCLDEVAEIASLPSFDGSLGETRMPDLSLLWIGCEGNKDYSKLYQQCQQFGCYARCLRLQNVLCGAETSQLLRNSRLQSLELRWIRSKEHIDGLCKLLNQNSESLTSIEFIHCKLSSYCINAICYSLLKKSGQTHGIKHFSINTSNFLETNPASLPLGLVSILSSGRSLHSLKLSDNHLGRNFAEMVFDILLNASSSLSILDLSDNNISGWLSELYQRSPSRPPIPLGIGKSLLSLRVLNLRDNNLDKDDADCLRYALVHMPSLEVLDLSDNPIEDDGLRNLIPYFVEVSERCTPFSDLRLESCDLSCDGMTQFINALSTLDRSLKSLSIANNGLGSKVAAALGKLLSTAIQVLNIEGIGLGASGFQELQVGITKELKLVKINISKNRGGNEPAEFLFTLISRAPELATVNAAYNCMPVKSLTIICSAVKASIGNLESIDLRGNNWDDQPGYASMIADVQCNGRPAFILSSSPTKDAPYDDEP